MSTHSPARVARFYTSARRHPWVLGKVADFKLWLGPYTPAQIVVAVVGAVALIQSVRWWTWMGPIPLIVWALMIWVVRRPKIAGRAPLWAAAGWLMLLTQPGAGRIGGRRAHDRSARPLLSGFVVQDLEESSEPPREAAVRSVARPARRAVRVSRADLRPRTRKAKQRPSRPPTAQATRVARPAAAVSTEPTEQAEAAVASTLQLLLARTTQEGKQR
ncbi:hypothetical protein AB0M87_31415 [Streptomyces sp. NPDC051320]|uniref:hypothetical protein n=1 Tax=Streptomyces sp. NPDC051320 TaxID=3154644 RepID=UPI003413B808